MKNICLLVARFLSLVVFVLLSGRVLAKELPSSIVWNHKCQQLVYAPTKAEFVWRSKDKLNQMVVDRDIWSLQKYLKKDMLKGNKPVPVPYLYNAAGIAAPGYGDYDPGSKNALAIMERQGEEVVRLLIWAGANPDEVGMHGLTSIMVSALYSHRMPKVSPRIAKRLLDAGANPNLRDVNGWTALMFAADNGSTKIVQLLRARGARTDFRNCAGQTATDLAAAKGHKQLARILSQPG
jgi:Ankyrin repeats (3 copies)